MKLRFFEWVLGITLMSALAGCASREQSSAVQIYGGKPVADSRWMSTVALLKYQSVDCSGVLVHPRLVITAAHCLTGTDESLEVYRGAGDDHLPLKGEGVVERFALSPKFGPHPDGYNDIAYILLKEPLPVGPDELIPILTRDEERAEVLQAGHTARIVGFGLRESGGFGSKYEADVQISSLNDNEVRMGGGGLDACSGDSGGPAYAQLKNGAWRVFAVVSRGRACGKGGAWSRIDANLCWIESDSGIDLNLPDAACELALP